MSAYRNVASPTECALRPRRSLWWRHVHSEVCLHILYQGSKVTKGQGLHVGTVRATHFPQGFLAPKYVTPESKGEVGGIAATKGRTLDPLLSTCCANPPGSKAQRRLRNVDEPTRFAYVGSNDIRHSVRHQAGSFWIPRC